MLEQITEHVWGAITAFVMGTAAMVVGTVKALTARYVKRTDYRLDRLERDKANKASTQAQIDEMRREHSQSLQENREVHARLEHSVTKIAVDVAEIKGELKHQNH